MAELDPDFDETLKAIFTDEEELDEVATFLKTKRITKATRLASVTIKQLTDQGLDLGLALELEPLLRSTTEAKQEPVAPKRESDTLIGALGAIIGQDVSKLPLRQLVQRLADSGEAEPDVVNYASVSHPILSVKGVVLAPGGKIDVAATLAYASAQSGTLIGQRWKNQRVVAVAAAFGTKVEVSPIDLVTVLQDGWDPKHMVEFGGLNEERRNFVAWVADSSYRAFLSGDNAAGFVSVVAKGKIGEHERYKLAMQAYDDEAKTDPSLRTKFVGRLYREPEVSPREPFRGRDELLGGHSGVTHDYADGYQRYLRR